MHAGLLSSVASEFQTACVQKVHSKDTTDDSVGVRAPYEDSLTVSLSSLNDALSSVDKIEEKVEVINVQLASDLDGSDVQGIGKEVLEENDDVVNVVVDPGNKKLQIEKKRVLVQIGPQHFDLLKLIGEGAFGKVILVRNRLNKKIYAMKVLSKKLLRKKNNVQYMKSERDILTRISHPFVVPLYFAFQSEKKLFLVMEFLAGGELFFHLRRRGLILEKEVRFYLAEMVLAIEFLHNNNVIHRDLKPENVLLTKEGHVCITDFGLGNELL